MKKEQVQEMIATLRPDLRAAVESLQAALEKSGVRKDVAEFKEKILKNIPRYEQTIFSFLPQQLAKTSIFFPLSDRELKEENRKINRIEQQTSWGRVVVEGIKLAIYEEDIFLALLHMAKNNTTKDDKNRPILKTHLPKVAKLLYGDKSYTKTTYERILRTLEHFELIRFELTVGKWENKGKKRVKREITTSMAGILTAHTYDEKTQDLTIYWNDHFLAYFLESILTNINLTLRRQLKKDGSKALLRFLCAHTNPDRMRIAVVLDAINYNTDQPKTELRRRLKSFIVELKKNGVLGNKTRLFEDDTVYFDIIKKNRISPTTFIK